MPSSCCAKHAENQPISQMRIRFAECQKMLQLVVWWPSISVGNTKTAKLRRKQMRPYRIVKFVMEKPKFFMNPSSQWCEATPQPAKWHCSACSYFYCADCQTALHPPRGPLKSHQLVSAEQFRCIKNLTFYYVTLLKKSASNFFIGFIFTQHFFPTPHS